MSKKENGKNQKIENIRVCIRMRPLLKHEDGAYWEIDQEENNIYTINYFASQELDESLDLSNINKSTSDYSQNKLKKKIINSLYAPQKFNFDKIYSYNSVSQIIYKEICQDVVKSVIDGYNGSIFMYGQTTSGKTFTMLGSPNSPGILPCSLNDIFIFVKQLEENNNNMVINIYCSYIEIYNEKINDLLNNSNNLKLIDDKKYGTIVSGAKRVKIKNFDQGIAIKDYGEENRNYRETLINEYSSRSHCIFQIYLEQFFSDEEGDVNRSCFSCLNLVDLAGSERINEKENKKKNIGETGYINKSLFMLTNVINKLAENSSSINKKIYIPYRDSKLTRLLSQSLGGNSLTTIICNISPATMNYYQTLSTLRFATRAKCVRLEAKTNEYFDDKDKIYYYQKEIRKLKELLRNKEKNMNLNNNMNYNEESFGSVSQYEYNKIVNAYQNLNEELENYKKLYYEEKKKSEKYKAQINGISNFNIQEEGESEEKEDSEEEEIIDNHNISNISANIPPSKFKSYNNFKLLKKENMQKSNGATRASNPNMKNKITKIKKINNNKTSNNNKDEYEQLKNYIRINRNKSYKNNLSLKRINSYDAFKRSKKVPVKTERNEENVNNYSQFVNLKSYNNTNNKKKNILKLNDNINKYTLTEYDNYDNNESNISSIYVSKTARRNLNEAIDNPSNGKDIKNNNINNINNNINYDRNEETINAIKNGNVFNMLDINYHEIMYNNKTPKQFDILKKLYDFKMDALEKTMDYYQSFLDEYYKKKINEIDSIKGLTEIVQNKKRIMIANITDEYKNNLNKLRNLYKEKKEELEYKFSMYMKNLSS